MKYDRATVEHGARTLYHADTGTTLPMNSECTAAQTATLALYIERVVAVLPDVRTWNIADLIAADRARQGAAA